MTKGSDKQRVPVQLGGYAIKPSHLSQRVAFILGVDINRAEDLISHWIDTGVLSWGLGGLIPHEPTRREAWRLELERSP